jgi:hypothetical protein
MDGLLAHITSYIFIVDVIFLPCRHTDVISQVISLVADGIFLPCRHTDVILTVLVPQQAPAPVVPARAKQDLNFALNMYLGMLIKGYTTGAFSSVP